MTDAWQYGRPREDGVVERETLLVRPVCGARRKNESGQHALRIEPEIGPLQRDEGPDQESAADEQHQRERQLRDDQRAACASSAVTRLAAATLFQRTREPIPRGVPRRNDA